MAAATKPEEALRNPADKPPLHRALEGTAVVPGEAHFVSRWRTGALRRKGLRRRAPLRFPEERRARSCALPARRARAAAMATQYNFKAIGQVPSNKDFIDVVLSKTQRQTPTVVHNGRSPPSLPLPVPPRTRPVAAGRNDSESFPWEVSLATARSLISRPSLSGSCCTRALRCARGRESCLACLS